MEFHDPAAAIQACLAVGAREFVVCGGARNVELIAGLAALGESVRCWSYPEERSAGFFALGRSRASGAPVVVVTTSGTAVAELLPAAVEAHYACVPLILLTADRPARFRGSGAPQAIEQVGVFGPYAVDELTGWGGDRPLHLNVCLEEPTAEGVRRRSRTCESLVGVVSAKSDVAKFSQIRLRGSERLEAFLDEEGELVVMLGCLPTSWEDPVRAFLERLGAPVLAEATSGLREAGFEQPDLGGAGRVLRIGGVPSCRAWRDLETADVPVFSVAPNGLTGLARESDVVREVDWAAVEIPERPAKRCGHRSRPAATVEGEWFRRLSECVPERGLVFLGNSLPIREWNQYASGVDRGLRCFANRGANGIDGVVSTFLGMAEGEAEAWCIVGDLTAVYDLAAPWVLPQMSTGNRRIVVINNGGGKIFRQLPALEGAGDRAMRMIENPHALRFEAWAGMWGLGYHRIERGEQLDRLPAGDLLLEIVIGDQG